MEWHDIKAKWKSFVQAAKEQWAELNEDELDRSGGDREELVRMVEREYGRSREQAAREVDEWGQRMI